MPGGGQSHPALQQPMSAAAVESMRLISHDNARVASLLAFAAIGTKFRLKFREI